MSSKVFIECAGILLFLVVVVKIAAQNCGKSGNEIEPNSLRNGGDATEGSWPWMVAIRKRTASGTYGFWCSGFLIDRRHVISAAHCYESTGTNFTINNIDMYKARIGHFNQDEGDEYGITRILLPPTYKLGQHYGDIAMLTLDREVNFPNFNPVCLPDEQLSRMNLTVRRMVIVGWPISFLGPIQPNLKYWTGLQVISNEECEQSLRRTMRRNFQRQFPRGISRDFLCTEIAEGHEDSVCAISGSPLMIQNGNRWFAVGSVSFGTCPRRPNIPEGYANLANYLEWIRENTRD